MFDKKAYNRKYYLTKVKPFRKTRPIIPDVNMRMKYTCLLCGLQHEPKRFEPTYFPRLRMVHFKGGGNIVWYDIEQLGGSEDARNILYGKLDNHLNHISKKCCSILKQALKLGSISKEEVSSLVFGFDIFAEKVKTGGVVNGARKVYETKQLGRLHRVAGSWRPVSSNFQGVGQTVPSRALQKVEVLRNK